MGSHHVYFMIGNAWLMCAMAISAFDGGDVQAACSLVVGFVNLFYSGWVQRSEGQVS